MAIDWGRSSSSGSGGGGWLSTGTPNDVGLASAGTPAPDANNVGKLNVDLSNPLGSATGAVGSIAGLVGGFTGAIGSIGIPGGPNLGGVAAAPLGVAQQVAGGVGDIGYGGVGVKQAVGEAGDVVSAPQKYIQTQVAKARLGGDGGPLGGGLNWFLNGPLGEGFNNQGDLHLPRDLQLQFDQGVPIEHIANEMADRNIGYTSDPTWNLLTSVALDPTMWAGGAVGEIWDAGKLAATQQAVRDAESVGFGKGFAAAFYKTVSAGLTKPAAAAMGQLTGIAAHAASDVNPGVFDDIKAIRNVYGDSAGLLAQEDAAIVSGNSALDVLNKRMSQFGEKSTALIMDDATRAQSTIDELNRVKNFPASGLRQDIAKTLGTLLGKAPSDPAQRAEETAQMLQHVHGGTIEDARKVFGEAPTEGQWLTARWGELGEAVKLDVATKANPAVQALRQAGSDFGRPGIISPETAARRDAVERWVADGEHVTGTDTNLGTQPDALTEAIGGGSPISAKVQSVARYTDAKAWMRDVLSHNPAIAEAFGKETATPGKVLEYLQNELATLPTYVKDVGDLPVNALPANALSRLRAWLAQNPSGYRLGFEPKPVIGEDGREFTYKTMDMGNGAQTAVRGWRPWSTEQLGLAQRGAMGRAYDALMGPISQTRVISEAKARMVKFGGQYGMSNGEVSQIFSRILSAASDLKTTPRATYGKFDEIFTDVLGSRYQELLDKGMNPINLVNHAFEGNFKTVGATQKLTGVAKTLGSTAGNWPVKIAEQAYPMIKFKGNPLFLLQQIVGHPIYLAGRGVNPFKGVEDSALRDMLASDMSRDGPVKSLYEAEIFDQVGRTVATHTTMGPDSALSRAVEAIKTSAPGRAVTAAKSTDVYRGAQTAGRELGLADIQPLPLRGGISNYIKEAQLRQAAKEIPEMVRDAVVKAQPDAWAKWVDKMGPRASVSDVVNAIINERLGQIARQKDLGFDVAKVAKETGITPTLEQQNVWNALSYAAKQGEKQAFRTQNFNPERGWLERTLNHPYLGLYPLSYMYGKVLPEFARAIFYKPFGRTAPLSGYAALNDVQNAITAQVQNDPEFARQIADNKGAIYLLQLLLPATPTNMPVNAPAWMRHLSASNQGGTKFNLGTEVTSDVQRIGVLNVPKLLQQAAPSARGIPAAVPSLAGMLGDISGTLDDQLNSIQSSLTGNP